MADEKYLTAEEVADHYCGEASAGALENWRARHPPFRHPFPAP